MFSGCVHLAVWLYDGTSWAGDVSWRKPILFGVSGGLTLLSAGQLFGKIPHRPRDGLLAPVLVAAMTLEVGLITFQQWRGVASHFNTSTMLDYCVDMGITALISLVTWILGDIGFRGLHDLRGTQDQRLAWKSGIAYLLCSCLIGFGILVFGHVRADNGLDPTRFGEAGVVKFPHGVAIHAIQFLPLAGWLMRRSGIRLKQRLVILRGLIGTTALMLFYSLIQTLAGRGRFEPNLLASAVLCLAVGLIGWTTWHLLRGLRGNVSVYNASRSIGSAG